MTTIKPINQNECLSINNKLAFKDTNGLWISKEPLTPQESLDFNAYIQKHKL